MLQFLAYSVLVLSSIVVGEPQPGSKDTASEPQPPTGKGDPKEAPVEPACTKVARQLPEKHDNGNYIYGTQLPFDRLLETIKVYEPKKPSSKIYKPVIFQAAQGKPPPTITYIEALKAGKDQKGFVKITEGGVGYRDVTLCIISRESEGVDYIVKVYGQ